MHDETAVRVELADRVQAAHEGAVTADALQSRATHTGHDAHVDHDVGAVGDLHAAARVGRINRAHAIGHDIERAPLHAALVQGVHLGMGLGRRHPVVVRTGVFLLAGADEGQVLHAGDVARVGTRQVAVREGFRVERLQFLSCDQFIAQHSHFGRRAVTPVDVVGLGERRNAFHPLGDFRGQVRERAQRARGCRHGHVPARQKNGNADYSDVLAQICAQTVGLARLGPAFLVAMQHNAHKMP